MIIDRKLKLLIAICLSSAFGLGVADTYGVNNSELVKIISTGLAYMMLTGLGLYALYCFYQDCQKSRNGDSRSYLAHIFGSVTIMMFCQYNYLTEGRSYYHAIGSTLLYMVFYSSIYIIVIEAFFRFLSKEEK